MRDDSDYRQDLSKQQAGLLALVSLPCAPSRSHSGFCTGSSITAAAPHRILTCFPLSPTRQNASSGTCCYSILCIYRIIFICLCKSGFPLSVFSCSANGTILVVYLLFFMGYGRHRLIICNYGMIVGILRIAVSVISNEKLRGHICPVTEKDCRRRITFAAILCRPWRPFWWLVEVARVELAS